MEFRRLGDFLCSYTTIMFFLLNILFPGISPSLARKKTQYYIQLQHLVLCLCDFSLADK